MCKLRVAFSCMVRPFMQTSPLCGERANKQGASMTYREQAFALMRGCGDRQCKVKPAKGMGSNDGCQCFKRLTTVQANQIIRTLDKADEDVQMLIAELEDRYHSTKCGCGHPACKRCQDDADTLDVLKKNQSKLIGDSK